MNICQGCFIKGSSLSEYICESCKYDYFRTPQGQNAMACIKELEKIKAEIREWYWQADKQKLSEDPCVVDAMTDLFIRTVDKHISELKGENNES